MLGGITDISGDAVGTNVQKFLNSPQSAVLLAQIRVCVYDCARFGV